MRLLVLIVSGMLTASEMPAASGVLATAPLATAQAANAPPPQEPAVSAPPANDANDANDLPVSLDRIREGLAKPAPGTALKTADLKPDFTVRVEEREHIQKILSALDVKTGPAPAGGIYAYEQQQRLVNKTERPLQQPYAAFSGGELITLAIEGLMQKYLGAMAANAITSGLRDRAQQTAREDVATAIVQYCEAQPDGGRSLHLCSDLVDR
jgi:hypothetical protein